jgi:hypothetical protein
VVHPQTSLDVTMGHYLPGIPFLDLSQPLNPYKVKKHDISMAILRNIFHRFAFDYGRPKGNPSIKELWSRCFNALKCHDYLTLDGKHLTGKGWNFIQDNEREFKAHE